MYVQDTVGGDKSRLGTVALPINSSFDSFLSHSVD